MAQWPTASSFFVRGALRLVALVVVVGAVGALVGGLLLPRVDIDCATGGFSIVDVEVAGSRPASAAVLDGCDDWTVRQALLWDFVFIAVYAGLLAAAVWFVGRRGFHLRALRRLQPAMYGAVAAAAVLDVVENAALLVGLGERSDGLAVLDGAARVASVVAWPKFVLLAAVIAYAVLGAIGWLARLERTPADPQPFAGEPEPAMGICLSGGGVRAATYGLGVLQTLDRAGLYRRARWLSAVSGGSYMAGAWAIARHREPGQPHDWTTDPVAPWADGSTEVQHLRGRLDYLLSRQGRLPGAIATLVGGLVLNVASLIAVLWLVARPLGWLVGSPLIAPGRTDAGLVDFSPDRRLVIPVVVWGVAAMALLGLWVFSRRLSSLDSPVSRPVVQKVLWTAAMAAVGVTAALAVVLLVLPALVAGLPALVRDHRGVVRAVQVVAASGALAAVGGVLRKPLSRAVPRLGGVLVLALALVLGAEFAAGAAVTGPVDDRGTWAVVLAGFALWYYVADPDWWSIQPFYRGRLRAAYATRRIPKGSADPAAEVTDRPDDAFTVQTLRPAEEPDLAALAGDRPELLVCTAMNVGDGTPARVGVPAYSFTFSPTAIRFHTPGPLDGSSLDHAVDTDRYARVFRRWDTPRLAPMTAVGMSGAAVTSAMGRFTVGSTKALLAFANVRLGMWMPNPRFVAGDDALPERPGYQRRRIGYLLKEVFAVYDPDDRYVYVSDGGHWENLGLVELLRRGCVEVFCVDSSGAGPESFATVAEAITLAAQECGVTVELPYEPMRAVRTDGVLGRTVPRDCAVGLITYPDGRQGLLWYLKASLTADAPSRLLAYKEKNPVFPNDSTTNQFFDTEKFECYRLLGQHCAGHALALRDAALAVLATAPGDPLPTVARERLSAPEQRLLGGLDGPSRERLRAALDAIHRDPPATANVPADATGPVIDLREQPTAR